MRSKHRVDFITKEGWKTGHKFDTLTGAHIYIIRLVLSFPFLNFHDFKVVDVR